MTLAAVCLLQPRIKTELAARVTGSFSDSTGSMDYRMLGWKVAGRMIAARPLLGSGPGTFKILLPTLADLLADRDPLSYWFLKEKMNEAHNEFLQAAVDAGIPGLLLFLWALAAVFRGILQRARAAGFHDGFFIASAAAGLAAVLVDAFSSIPFHVVPTRVAFWAIAAGLLAWPPPPPALDSRPGRGRCRRWSGPWRRIWPSSPRCRRSRRSVPDLRLPVQDGHDAQLYAADAGGARLVPQGADADPSVGTGQVLLRLDARAPGPQRRGAAFLEKSTRNFQDIYLYKNLGIACERMGRIDDDRPVPAVAGDGDRRARGQQPHRPRAASAGKPRGGGGVQGDAAGAPVGSPGVLEPRRHSDRRRALRRGGGGFLNPDPLWKTPDAYAVYGVALLKAGRLEEARAEFLRTLELDPRSVKARNSLGALRYMQGDLEGRFASGRRRSRRIRET